MANTSWDDCGDAVETTVKALTLSGLDTAQDVVKLTVPRAPALPRLKTHGGVLIAVGVGTEKVNQSPYTGTNASDDVQYPVHVAFLKPANQDQSKGVRQPFLTWRQQVRKEFHLKRLSGVSSSLITLVTPGQGVFAGNWAKNELAGDLTLWCVLREPRS